MKIRSAYKKYIYWLNEEEEAGLRKERERRGKKLRRAKGVVCTPLDRITKIASVAPTVWNETCARQGSWYRASRRNGLYLIISNIELEGYEEKKACTITESAFEPGRTASLRDKMEMTRNREVLGRVPPRWFRVGDFDKKIYLRWSKRFGSDIADYDTLFLTHTANHINFIAPLFFAEEDGLLIPYSIDCSANLCSSCVELFQIIGTGYPKKLIRPCPGACIFARLEPDRYLLVESASRVETLPRNA